MISQTETCAIFFGVPTMSERKRSSTSIDLAVAALFSGNSWPWKTVIDDVNNGSYKIDDRWYPVGYRDLLSKYRSVGRARARILRSIKDRSKK